jgi:hypothetical protein
LLCDAVDYCGVEQVRAAEAGQLAGVGQLAALHPPAHGLWVYAEVIGYLACGQVSHHGGIIAQAPNVEQGPPRL